MNGLLNLLSSAVQVLQAGYLGAFDASFAQGIGGYPAGAIVAGSAPGAFWVSTADANVATPGAEGAAWQSLFSGYATQAWANGQFLRLASTATQAVTGPVTFSGTTTVPTPTDYTQRQAIGAADADARYARLTGDNALKGVQTVVSSTRYAVAFAALNPTAFDGTNNNPSPSVELGAGSLSARLYTQGITEATSQLALVFNGSSIGQTVITFGVDGSLTTSGKGAVAFTSQLPTAGAISGGYYKKIPISGGGFLLTQMFLVTVSNTSRVSFPLAYSTAPASPQLSLASNNDVDLASSSVDAAGFTVTVVSSGSFLISVYVEGIVQA
ncbi:hypothetical protein [Acetobacter okinawensis]|uniref:hypothetical protein n=1 Tax=Acetobacter okinawensis TaxID=1076594 RepID=UPI00209E441A|nr:hypothetical protein [Acetobacter okinawensis]MCP1212292.1 hypothetical protein [Acetobacter okinawensis]